MTTSDALAHEWLGRLSMAIAMALPRRGLVVYEAGRGTGALRELREALDLFLASGAASDELARMLREEMR